MIIKKHTFYRNATQSQNTFQWPCNSATATILPPISNQRAPHLISENVLPSSSNNANNNFNQCRNDSSDDS